MRSLLPLAAVLAFTSSIVADEIGTWPTAEICRAGAEAYFFLDGSPVHRGYNGWHQLQSLSGNAYRCQVAAGGHLRFSRKRDDGVDMNSQSATFTVDGDQLVVVTDMMTVTFEKTDTGYQRI